MKLYNVNSYFISVNIVFMGFIHIVLCILHSHCVNIAPSGYATIYLLILLLMDSYVFQFQAIMNQSCNEHYWIYHLVNKCTCSVAGFCAYMWVWVYPKGEDFWVEGCAFNFRYCQMCFQTACHIYVATKVMFQFSTFLPKYRSSIFNDGILINVCLVITMSSCLLCMRLGLLIFRTCFSRNSVGNSGPFTLYLFLLLMNTM